MSVAKKEYKRITVKSLVDMKKRGEKISMLTAYDYSMAKIIDKGAGMSTIRPRLMDQYRNQWKDRNGANLSTNRLHSRVDSIAGSALNRLEESGFVNKSRVQKEKAEDMSGKSPTFVPPGIKKSSTTDRVQYFLSDSGYFTLVNQEEEE